MMEVLESGLGESLAHRLREARLALGLSQRQLAAAAGISLATVRDLEQGRTTRPSWITLERLDGAMRTSQVSPADVCVAILGPLAAASRGIRVLIGPARTRTVLGLMVLCQPAGISTDDLLEALWGERPPPTAVTMVQGCISRLRRILGCGQRGRRHLVEMTDGRYRLAGEVRIDVTEFLGIAARATHVAERGDYGLACRLYESSLAVWRGPVLADVEVPRQHPALADLAHRRDEVVLRYARAALARGTAEQVLPHLRMLCDREPYDESAHAAFMTALALVGRAAEALAIFDGIRRRLDDQLGIRPGRELAATHIEILRQRF
jgi:DNA-binding SARP family transcriptional activator/DNA-binding XRE family transcriptional regulator